MIRMPLGPQFTQIFAITDAQFGMLVSAYTLAAAIVVVGKLKLYQTNMPAAQ
jgi:predicted MFS family arabinose efflux permease